MKKKSKKANKEAMRNQYINLRAAHSNALMELDRAMRRKELAPDEEKEAYDDRIGALEKAIADSWHDMEQLKRSLEIRA